MIGLLLVGLASFAPLIAGHFWRRGATSDRTLAMISVGRFPVFVLAIGIVMPAPLLLALAIAALALLPSALFYPTVLDMCRRQGAGMRRKDALKVT